MDEKSKMERNVRPGPKLDVPSRETSLMRKEVMIQRLFKEKSKEVPTPVHPSSVLAQVKSFLPKMKIANEELEKSDPAIEFGTVPPDMKTYIEMNLALYEESSDSDDAADDDDIQLTQKLSDQPPIKSASTVKLIEDITPDSSK